MSIINSTLKLMISIIKSLYSAGFRTSTKFLVQKIGDRFFPTDAIAKKL